MFRQGNHSNIRCCMVGITNYFGDARVKGYAEWLAKNGHSVDVISVHKFKSQKMVEENGVRVFTVPSPQQKKSRISYLLDYGLSFLVLSYFLLKLYIKNHYDVIHFHNMPDFIVFSGLLPKILGAKIILDIHDPMPEAYLSKFPQKEKGLVFKLVRFEEYISCVFANAIITANTHFTDNLVKRGIPASKITTILNFPDANIFHPSKRQLYKSENHERYTLIFPGTIAPRYGLEVAIRALPQLKDKIPHIRLLIIGFQVEYAKTLISLAEQLGVSEQLEMRPSIRNSEVPEQLVQADIGIYPALPDCHMSIAIPGKLLEYAIMGLPILSSRLQIVEEMFDDSSVVFFQPGDPDQFAQGVLKLYNDQAFRENLVRQADLKLIQKRTLEQEMQLYLDFLLHLLPDRSLSLHYQGNSK